MSTETDARRRCERLLALLAEAMEMERAVNERATQIDASPRSLLRPILEEALVRLEPLLRPEPTLPLNRWISEMTDLELQLDAAISQRGWRVLSPDGDAASARADHG
ncbi:MAG: hypothetical protein EHM87_02055 [Burkholderiales bacterium]|nr:MAG: hypothetical protein EHM87_02055 [Burkholderiales bacterium]